MRQARTNVSAANATQALVQPRPKVQKRGITYCQVSRVFFEERKEQPGYPMREAVLGAQRARWFGMRRRSRRHNIPHSAPTR